jgi:hypothetical protein
MSYQIPDKDISRESLITQFHCAKCGGILQIAVNDGGYKLASDTARDDNVTGALKAVNRILIHPCKKCYNEAVRPLELIREALKNI